MGRRLWLIKMFTINCPYCGKRDQCEFSNGGEAHVARPKDPEQVNDREWSEYVFVRANPKGVYYERWVHTHGCKNGLTLSEIPRLMKY